MTRRTWTLLAQTAALLALAGTLGAASGLVPIKASSGHSPITAWILEFGKRRSVATHTLLAKAPDLKLPHLVMKGAGHYEIGCRPCHGSPGSEPPRIAAAMSPPPPYLPPRISRWQPKELSYIVKHGIKFTGMPAWPSKQRDDEVEAVVAFLLASPKLNAQSYRQLVHGDELVSDSSAPLRAPSIADARCAACHGTDGLGRGTAAFPKLAGQPRTYLLNALTAYAGGKRHSGTMQPIAAALSSSERDELADYYSRLPDQVSSESTAESSSAAVQARTRGERIATHGIPERGLPSCADCHGPSGHRRNPAYPLLAGQYEGYLLLQLELFQQQRRGGSAYAELMRHVASRLTSEQARDVAAFYAALTPEPRPTESGP